MLYDPKWETTVTPIKTIEPWQQVLIDAANLIKKKGWVKGHYETNKGFCMVGAIRMAAKNTPMAYDAEMHLSRSMGTYNILAWNDHNAKSKEHVIYELRKAAGLDVSPPNHVLHPNPKQIVVDSSSWTGRY